MRVSTFTKFDEFLTFILSPINLVMVGLPVLLGLGLGFLISRGMWMYALVLAILIPFTIVFMKRPFIGVIFWLLLMPLISALPNPDLMYWGVYRILIFITLFFFLLTRFLNTKKFVSLQLGTPELVICLLAGFVSLSIIYSKVDLQTSFRLYIDRILIPLCIYLIMRITTLEERDYKYLQWAVFFIAAIQVFIGFLWITAPQFVPAAWRPVYSTRSAGTLVNPNIFAVILLFCVCLLFDAAMNHKSTIVRYIFIITCGLCIISMFLTMERAVWLAGSLVILGMFALYPKHFLKYTISIIIVIIIFGGGFFLKYISAAAVRIGEVQQVYDRIVTSDAMIQMIQIKPIFGWGFNSLNEHIKAFYRYVGSASIGIGFVTSHNSYLTILSELGLVGFILYIIPFMWCFIRTIQVWKRIPKVGNRNRNLLAILWLFVLFYFIVSNFIDMRFYPFAISLWWMTLGLIASIITPYTRIINLQDNNSIPVEYSTPVKAIVNGAR